MIFFNQKQRTKGIQKNVRGDEKASETNLASKRKGGRVHWIYSKGLWNISIRSARLYPVKQAL